MRFAFTALLTAASIGFATTAAAQAGLPPRSTVISIQPLTAMFDVYSAEVEHALAPTWTLGAGSSFWNKGDSGYRVQYLSGDVKLRYYPEGDPFRGFSFGVQGGYTRLTEKDSYGSGYNGGISSRNTASGPTIGVALDYNWLLGPPQKFYLGLGLGAKRIFAKNDAIGNATFGYPTARVSIGYAF